MSYNQTLELPEVVDVKSASVPCSLIGGAREPTLRSPVDLQDPRSKVGSARRRSLARRQEIQSQLLRHPYRTSACAERQHARDIGTWYGTHAVGSQHQRRI